MKELPKLMKNSSVSITVVSEEMPEFLIQLVNSPSWPSLARYDSDTHVLRLLDAKGATIGEHTYSGKLGLLPNFGLAFIGVTESTVDFESRSQFIAAKMRAINLDSQEHVHGDNYGYDE
jgi:hypothetical protein